VRTHASHHRPRAVEAGRWATRRLVAFGLGALAALCAAPASADWVTDLAAGAFSNSNLGNATAGPDVHAVNGLSTSLSTGPVWELRPGTSLILTADLRSEALDRFTTQDNVAASVKARVDEKIGLGRSAPHVYLAGSQSRLEFRDDLRSGWLSTFTGGARGSFGDQLVLRSELGYEHRSGTDAPPVRAGLASNVFDQSNRRVGIGADFSATDRLLLQFDVTWRRGDADYIETTTPADTFAGASAAALDRGFGPSVFVEKVQARALLLDWSVSWALGEHASLNATFRRQLSLDTTGTLYTRSVPAITYQYRFD
jgi:hypothetical protein